MQRIQKWLKFWFYIGIHPTPAMEGEAREVTYEEELEELDRQQRTQVIIMSLLAAVLFCFASCADKRDGSTSTTSTGTTVNEHR